MPTITLAFTDAQIAGIDKARAAYNLQHDKAQIGTAAAYVQMVMDKAADSYAHQWADDTKEGLAAQLAVMSEAKARAEAEAAAKSAQVESEKARADALHAEKAEVAK